jgi:uncharacterized repeat protein (TIGR03803 family)
VFDNQGNLYGTTGGGGTNQCGTVFKLSPSSGASWTETQLFSFPGSYCYSYQGSVSAVIFDSHGNLYGSNEFATGDNNWGIVYELSPPSSGTQWNETVLHTFTGYSDGEYPVGSVVMDSAGVLYGAASQDGTYGQGQIYKLVNSGSTWTKTAIHNFTGVDGDGANPEAGLLLDSAGNLYGTTLNGGVDECNQCGTVFKLAPSGDGYRETILHSFSVGIDGSAPYAQLIFDSEGNLYGTTSSGGAGNEGTVFEIKP